MSPEQVSLAASYGIDISEEALEQLDDATRRERLDEFFIITQAEQVPIPASGNFVPTKAQVKSGKRESFAKALEDAFWDMGGVHFLKALAAQQPLEFAKLAVKLIPVSSSDAMPQATFVFNMAQPKDERVIEHNVEEE